MQIICNNCGNDLTFPNEQHLVTCPHCLTHLQIEELENTISATIVENPDFDDTIFANDDAEIIESKNIEALKNLLELENEYSGIIEKNFFHSITVGSKFRPVFRRGLWRLSLGLFLLIFPIFVMINLGHIIFFFTFISLFGGFLLNRGYRELKRWNRLYKYEKHYFEFRDSITSYFDDLKLNKELQMSYKKLQANYQENIAIRQRYFFIKLFGKSINIGTTLSSQAIRLLVIGLPLGHFIFYDVFDERYVSYFIYFLIVLFLAINIFRKSYKNIITYQDNLEERKDIIQQLNNYLSR